MDNDVALLQRIARNFDNRLDAEEALGELMRLWHVRLSRHVGRIVKDEHYTEDVMVQVWNKVWINAHLFNADRPFPPWLYGIAKNHALDHLRGRRKEKEMTRPLRDNPPGGECGDAILAGRQDLADLYQMLAAESSLTDNERWVFWESFKGLGFRAHSDLARELGVQNSTITNLFQRASEKLTDRLRGNHP